MSGIQEIGCFAVLFLNEEALSVAYRSCVLRDCSGIAASNRTLSVSPIRQPALALFPFENSPERQSYSSFIPSVLRSLYYPSYRIVNLHTATAIVSLWRRRISPRCAMLWCASAPSSPVRTL